MPSVTTVTLPIEQKPLFEAALRYYKFETGAGFFRICAYLLIEHYQRGDSISLPFNFSNAKQPDPVPQK